MLPPHAIAYISDVALLAILTATGSFATAISPIRFKQTVHKVILVSLVVVEILFASYPNVLREYMAFPVNIFDADWSSTTTLISDYMGITALLPALFAMIITALALFVPLKIMIPNKIRLAFFFLILILFTLTLQRTSPQPFVFSLQKKIESIIKNEKRVVPSLVRTYSKSDLINEPRKLTYSGKEIANFKNIIVIVLEGVTSNNFEKEFLTISNGYYEQNKNNAVYYKNYYTTNLDSYTSLISMVTAIEVPYRAYADESLYEKVNTAPSLTEDLRKRGFYTIFVSTYEYQPFVPTRSYWNKIYERNDLPSLDKWVSLGSNRMESATEDKAAISTIVENVKSHKNTFVLHEMVYGHSPEWRAKTGKTQLSYYNEYLLELSRKLEEEKLLSKTLFVIVSDHGNRAKSSEVDNYRVPLLIVGKSVSFDLKEALLSHLQLPQIIYHYAASDEHPTACKEIFFVGSTEKWIYGKLTKQNEYLFIDDAPGTLLARKEGLNPIQVRNEFQNYVDGFAATYGEK